MEFAALAGLLLFFASEAMPYTPLEGNGVVEGILAALRKAFPKPTPEEFKGEDEEKEEDK
jgi:hypothetical protein